MKVVLLTTDTTHHTYFAWRLNAELPLACIFLESRAATASFETHHPFEEQRDAYEREVLLSDFQGAFTDIADTRGFESCNSEECLSAIQAIRPDVAIVFGTGKLERPVLETPSTACLNLHGGNPEEYRGLDTHLWAIYHEDFDNLVTTLHHVDEGLDTGEIVFQSRLELSRECRLHELRAMNTKVCVDLSVLALRALASNAALPSRKQLSRGRYYSFIPSVLKEICVKKFERYVSRL